MLHADRSEKNLRESFYGSHVNSPSLGFSRSSLSEASELESLLSQALSPNKRAVILALIHAWESRHHRIHLEHTS
jgi:hypothetical protein